MMNHRIHVALTEHRFQITYTYTNEGDKQVTDARPLRVWRRTREAAAWAAALWCRQQMTFIPDTVITFEPMEDGS